MVLAAQITLGIYAILLIAGGIIGYIKAGSRPSLIAGLSSGVAALICLAFTGPDGHGIRLGAALAAAMLVLFAFRLSRRRKFMPSGLLLAVSGIVVLILGAALAAG
jgi:uncharacterized membrane protein (UPF0136 family)